MAAAEGTDGVFRLVVLEARWGLRSWLFFRDPDNCDELMVPGFRGGRTGETSLDGFGDRV